MKTGHCIEVAAAHPRSVAGDLGLTANAVTGRLGGTLSDFTGYRMRISFPPIPTRLVYRHELPDRG